MKVQIPSITPVLTFNFKDWFVDSTKKLTELVKKFDQLNDRDQTNHSYDENVSNLNQALTTLNEAVGTVRANLNQVNKQYTDNDIVGKFAELSNKVMSSLKSVHFEQPQIKELNNNLIPTENTAYDLYELYGLYVVQYIVNIPSGSLANLSYKLLTVQHNINNLKDGYHFDYFAILIDDQYYVLNIGLDTNLLIKYPINVIIDGVRDEVTNNGTNDPKTSINNIADITKNSISNAVQDDKNYVEQNMLDDSSQLSGADSQTLPFYNANL